MWEFILIHKQTNQEEIIFGYTLSDAFKREPLLDPNEWVCMSQEYID